MEKDENCWVVPCVKCKVKQEDRHKESPDGCVSCGMLDWLCFDTAEEAEIKYKELNNY